MRLSERATTELSVWLFSFFMLIPLHALAETEAAGLEGLSDREIAEVFRASIMQRDFSSSTGPMLTWALDEVAWYPVLDAARIEEFNEKARAPLGQAAKLISAHAGVNYRILEIDSDQKGVRGYIIYGSKDEIVSISKILFEALGVDGWRETLVHQHRYGLPFCTVVILGNSKNETVASVITIQRGDFMESCIFEELYQSTGLVSDVAKDIPSILGLDDNLVRPTELDILLLKILATYPSGLTTGPTLRSIEARVKELRDDH